MYIINNYLSTELKVNHDNGDLRAGDDQNDKHQEQKAKHVVELILPDGLHAKSQINRCKRLKINNMLIVEILTKITPMKTLQSRYDDITK